MIDYNLILYIGLGLIVGGFCLFLYSEHRIRQLDIELWKNEQLLKSFNKAKNDNRQYMVLSNNGASRNSHYLLVQLKEFAEDRAPLAR